MGDEYNTVLSTLERRITNGVATSMGLVGGGCTDGGTSGGLAIEVSVRSSAEEGGGRHLLPWRGIRRTIQKGSSRILEENANADILVEGLSMDPADKLDSETGK